MKKTIAIISILAIGAFAGNMLNIALTYVLHWKSINPVAFINSFRADFPLLLAPTALTLLPAWLGSLWSFLVSQRKTVSRKYWLYAFAGLSFTIGQTSILHVPMNLDFMAGRYSSAMLSSKLQIWAISHWVRIVVALFSGVYAILGFQQSFK